MNNYCSKFEWQNKRYMSTIARNKERGRFFVKVLSEFYDLTKIKLIEMGCGPGWIAVELARYCPNVVGVDIDDEMINLATSYSKTENVSVIYEKCDVCTTTDYPIEYFDVVIAPHLLEHAKSHENPIREAHRILKNNGILILTCPNNFWIIEQHYNLPFLHWLPKKIASKYVRLLKRGYDYSGVTKTPNYFEILSLLKRNGFIVEDISYRKLKNNVLGTILEKSKFLRYLISCISPGCVLMCKKYNRM